MGPEVTNLIPRSARLLEIAGQCGPVKDKLPYGLADCGTPHGKGFLVLFEDAGTTAVGRVGHICGRNRFGTSWAEAQNEFGRKERAAQVEDARQRFLSRAGDILPALERLAPTVAWVSAVRDALAPVTPACVEAATRA